MAKTEGASPFADAVAEVRGGGEPGESGLPPKRSHKKGGARPGAGRPPGARSFAGVGPATPPEKPPEPMTAEEAGALLKQLDSMIVTLAGTRPLSDEEALQAGKQLAPVVPGLLGKLTPETVAVFGLALLYVPRIVEVWATRRARDAARKAGAVEGATAQPEFRVELDGGPKTSEQPPRPITDREALGLGIVKERADPIR